MFVLFLRLEEHLTPKSIELPVIARELGDAIGQSNKLCDKSIHAQLYIRLRIQMQRRSNLPLGLSVARLSK